MLNGNVWNLNWRWTRTPSSSTSVAAWVWTACGWLKLSTARSSASTSVGRWLSIVKKSWVRRPSSSTWKRAFRIATRAREKFWGRRCPKQKRRSGSRNWWRRRWYSLSRKLSTSKNDFGTISNFGSMANYLLLFALKRLENEPLRTLKLGL